MREGKGGLGSRLAFVAFAVAVLELSLFSRHLVHGGLYEDDWPIAEIARHSGVLGLFGQLVGKDHGRPVGAIYLAVTAGISGTSGWLHAIWGMLTLLFEAIAVAWFLLVLNLRMSRVLLVVALLLLFPFSDSTWLWYVESVAGLSIGLAALGGVAAHAGTQRSGRASVLYHGLALILFAASVLTYQVAAALIALSLLVYLPRVARRRAITLWLVDIFTLLVAIASPRLIGGPGQTAVPVMPLHAQLHHAKLMADQSLTLLAKVLVPWGAPHRDIVVPVAVLVLISGAAGGWWRGDRRDPARRELRRWVWWALAGCLVVAAAYAAYVPAPEAWYQPLGQGANNRTNALAAVGYAILVVALLAIVSTWIVKLTHRVRWASAIAVLGAVVIAVGYARMAEADVTLWDDAAKSQAQQLTELSRISRPPSRSTLYVFGGRGDVAPGVTAFRLTWDLNSAAQLMWSDASIRAYPIFTGTQMRCDQATVVPLGFSNGDGPGQAGRFGRSEFVQLPRARVAAIRDRHSCQRAVSQFIPGSPH